MKNLKISIVLFSLLHFSITSYSQKYKKGIEYKLNMEKLIATNEITWYGWDFSNMKITDPKQFSQAKAVKEQHIPALIGLLNEQFTLRWLERQLKKEKFNSDLTEIQKRYTKINEENLVTFESYELTIDSIKSIVKSYTLTRKSGIGFVVIMENLNKPKRYTTSFPTFFDIETREVLYATKMKGKPGSKYGYAKYWEEGILETFYYYFKKYYL